MSRGFSDTCFILWAIVRVGGVGIRALGFFHAALRRHRFTICAEGGGLEPSPKAYEALLKGSIPIVRKSPVLDAYLGLPLVVVDQWEASALDREFLDFEYQRILRQFDYWRDVIFETSARTWEKRIRGMLPPSERPRLMAEV